MSYEASDIKSLTFRDGVRERIQMYLGSADNNGAYQALKEIINNSTDEALVGYGKKIIITVDESTNRVSVRDFGRGVPFLVKPDGTNVLVDIYTKAHTGGKFDSNSYKNVAGLNGIGGSCVCLSAYDFRVESYRNGKTAIAIFRQGILSSYQETTTHEPNGTFVSFIPDPNVFKDEPIHYNYETICDEIESISFLYSGIIFEVKSATQSNSYCAKNGIIDYIGAINRKPLHNHIIYKKVQDTNGDTLEIAFQWGNCKESGTIFVNGLRCPEGGTPITGAKTAITKTFNNLSSCSFESDAIRNGLCYVINCSVGQPSFANQTKTKINNANLRTLASAAFTEALNEMHAKYKDEFDRIVDLVKRISKADEAAEKARNAVLNLDKELQSARASKIVSTKLREARKLGQNSILLCVEGLSAGASVSKGRDPEHVGILMLRGKAINCLSNPLEDILANEEVRLMIQALGLSYGKPYDSSKLRYGKVAICSDADFDGSHIGLLIMAMLYRLFPQFVKEGRLCWLRPPLMKIGQGSGARYFYSEQEFENRVKKANEEITFYKGLGQMDEQDLKLSMFGPNQHLESLTYSEDAGIILEQLMGEDVEPRKEFVFNNIDFSEFSI